MQKYIDAEPGWCTLIQIFVSVLKAAHPHSKLRYRFCLKHTAIIYFTLVKMKGHPKAPINMHVLLSLQFTKQLIILPCNKSAAEATDCFDTPSGFRFIVHNKHMSRF